MNVILAGYNVDADLLREVAAASPDRDALTPETVAAAYARISRSPKSVPELRSAARSEVDKARRSNEIIVFDMGHSSIAEHAVFNLDILGISRLAVEDIEHFRLCSYTEKSQRYVLLKDDVVLPEEVRQSGLTEMFMATIHRQNAFYAACYEKLAPHVFAKYPDLASDPAMRSTLEGWAKEDARYAIALATETQLGMTLNARNLELMIRRLSASPLAESRACAQALYDAAKPVAPSLIRYTAATDYDRFTRENVRKAFDIACPPTEDAQAASPDAVHLLETHEDADDRVLAALYHTVSRRSHAECREAVDILTPEQKKSLFLQAFQNLRPYDSTLREFEYAELLFELVISASCYAQMKRHRMATLTCQPYDPALGVTVPPSICEIGMDEAFLDLIGQTNDTYEQLRKACPDTAPYILTNAHRRRVLMKVNARELYHIGRLRSDRHAQWDIRRVADAMTAQGQAAMPLTLMLAAGKDGYSDLYRQIFA